MTSNVWEMLDRRLQVRGDMNLDGVVTISDVWLWLQWLYFLPGDLAALVLLDSPVGNFFEITLGSLQGVGSGVLSFFFWFVVFEPLFRRRKS
jgi:hypothetical protein